MPTYKLKIRNHYANEDFEEVYDVSQMQMHLVVDEWNEREYYEVLEVWKLELDFRTI